VDGVDLRVEVGTPRRLVVVHGHQERFHQHQTRVRGLDECAEHAVVAGLELGGQREHAPVVAAPGVVHADEHGHDVGSLGDHVRLPPAFEVDEPVSAGPGVHHPGRGGPEHRRERVVDQPDVAVAEVSWRVAGAPAVGDAVACEDHCAHAFELHCSPRPGRGVRRKSMEPLQSERARYRCRHGWTRAIMAAGRPRRRCGERPS
jgi:hypothetical protein